MKNRKEENNTLAIIVAFLLALACWNSCDSDNYNNGYHVSDPEINVIR